MAILVSSTGRVLEGDKGNTPLIAEMANDIFDNGLQLPTYFVAKGLPLEPDRFVQEGLVLGALGKAEANNFRDKHKILDVVLASFQSLRVRLRSAQGVSGFLTQRKMGEFPVAMNI